MSYLAIKIDFSIASYFIDYSYVYIYKEIDTFIFYRLNITLYFKYWALSLIDVKIRQKLENLTTDYFVMKEYETFIDSLIFLS